MPSKTQGHVVQYVMSLGDITINHLHHSVLVILCHLCFSTDGWFLSMHCSKDKSQMKTSPTGSNPGFTRHLLNNHNNHQPRYEVTRLSWVVVPGQACSCLTSMGPPDGDPSPQRAVALLRDPHCQLLCQGEHCRNAIPLGTLTLLYWFMLSL